MNTHTTSALLAEEIADIIACERELGRPIRVVGLTGAPGSGKTTVTALLAGILTRRQIPVAGIAPMDGFHLSNTLLDRFGTHDRKGAPDTFDVWGFVSLLERIQRAEHPVFAPDYRRDLHEPVAASIEISCEGIVLTEGNYLSVDRAGWREVRERIDLLIHIDVPEGDVLNRLVARHEAYGRDRIDAAHWVRTVDAVNMATVNGYRNRADHVVRAPQLNRPR